MMSLHDEGIPAIYPDEEESKHHCKNKNCGETMTLVSSSLLDGYCSISCFHKRSDS